MKKVSTRSSEWRSVVENRHWGAREAKQVLAVWEQSGEPVAAFARGHGLSPARLLRWRSRLSGESRRPGPTFHPVRVVPTAIVGSSDGVPGVADVPALELMVGGARRILIRRGFDPEVLERVVRAVESWAC